MELECPVSEVLRYRLLYTLLYIQQHSHYMALYCFTIGVFYLIALTCVCMLLKNRLLLVTYQAKGLTPIGGLYLESRRVYVPGCK